MSDYEVNTTIKIKMLIVLVITILCCAISVCLYVSEGHIVEKKISDYSDYLQDSNLRYSIDEVRMGETNENGYLQIIGWAFEEDIDIVRYNCHIGLEDTLRDTVYILPTMMVTREDVGEYFENSGYNDSGFYSKAQMKKMQLNNSKLEIVIIYENNDSQIYCHTGMYIES